jgi:proline dehydrogenase
MDFNNTQNAFEAKSTSDLKQAAFLFRSMANPNLTRFGIWFTNLAFRFGLPITGIIKKTIFHQFCGGENLDEAQSTSESLRKFGVSVIMDYGVEGKSNEEEFERTTANFLETIRFVANKPNIPFISLKVTAFSRFGLLEKIHAEEPLTGEEQVEFNRVNDRIERICAAAVAVQKMILIDAEETWIQKPVDDLANALMEKYNTTKAYIFNTFQLYCTHRLAYLKTSHQLAAAKNYQLGAKLVRGAYMEKERKRALELGYVSPIQPTKAASDEDFNAAVTFGLQHLNQIDLFIGTHNDASCLMAVQQMEKLGIPAQTDQVHFSQLYGMSDNISFNLAKAGYRVSKYLPYGPVRDVIPYLMRRAQENTSVAGQTGRELLLINTELRRRRNP